MLEGLWNADEGLWLGAFGFVMAIASLVYARNQARGAKAQVESARRQSVEALLAAQLVAKGARETAAEALRAAGLVAETARQQAVEALRAAELLANSAVSARLREMRARHLRANPHLPQDIQDIIKDVGGPDAYSVMLDSMDIAQEIYFLRKRGMVSDEQWRTWMNDQMVPIAQSPSFDGVFQRAADQGVLFAEFVKAFEPVLHGRRIADPGDAQRVVPGTTQDVARAAPADGTRPREADPATRPATSPVPASVASPRSPPAEPSGPRQAGA